MTLSLVVVTLSGVLTYSFTEGSISVGPVSIGKARVVRHAVVYQDKRIPESEKKVLVTTR